ncbi:hypothetical protein [Frigoribacterium sp. Leaf172]|uniref:hypothetical protein n=1 Tax=Frigoribacterium sp. Leaf172 TaxID=1736285 RepID=UPI0006F5E2D6|nr:hypothetical protein [Frigoribacterium sp. Leaf172]KQR61837.1 hypothetical protein ASF89_15160 [Frigoribacterium sp. Leaf172]
MIDTFVQRPTRPMEWAADAVRALAALSVVVVGIGWGFVEIAVLMLALAAVLVPRFLGVRAGFDVMVGVTVLVAAWSSVFELYTRVDGWDIVVHVALNGVLAALAVIVAQLVGFLPSHGHRAGLIVSTVAVGLATGVLWEIGEWWGHNIVDDAIYVGYDDTLGDLVSGGAGALVAGLALPFLTARSRLRTADRPLGDAASTTRHPGASVSG